MVLQFPVGCISVPVVNMVLWAVRYILSESMISSKSLVLNEGNFVFWDIFDSI